MAGSLKDRLGAQPRRTRVVADCVELVEAQVRSKSGLSGIAIKGAYGTIKRIKRGVVPDVVDGMLDDWLDRIQPYYDAWRDSPSGTLADHLMADSDAVAEALLTVTDQRAERSKHKTAKRAYQKMRGSAKTNVVEAIPDLGRLLQRHVEELAADGGD